MASIVRMLLIMLFVGIDLELVKMAVIFISVFVDLTVSWWHRRICWFNSCWHWEWSSPYRSCNWLFLLKNCWNSAKAGQHLFHDLFHSKTQRCSSGNNLGCTSWGQLIRWMGLWGSLPYCNKVYKLRRYWLCRLILHFSTPWSGLN